MLDGLYDQFNIAHAVADPVYRVRRYTQTDDQEVVGFIAGALAFGRVTSVLASIDAVLAVMGPHPAAYVRRFDPARDAAGLAAIVHRWTSGADLAALIWILRQMIDAHGSIEGFFAAGHDAQAEDVQGGLESFSTRAMALDVSAVYGTRRPRPGVAYFFSRPSSGGACKRLNLFLRWMVRKDVVDLGLWTAVRPVAAGGAARHARHPRRPLPGPDALRLAGVADGRGHHARAAPHRPRRPGALRLLAVPRRDDGRLRLRHEEGRHAVPAEGRVSARA